LKYQGALHCGVTVVKEEVHRWPAPPVRVCVPVWSVICV
jgi:hypothetical protein